MIDFNTGIIEAPPSPSDWVLGASPLTTQPVVEKASDWLLYLPSFERQSSARLETYNCTAFSYTNVVETQLNRLIKLNLISSQLLQFLTDNNYIVNGQVNFSDRALGSMAGTFPPGNYLQKVADTARTQGLIPEALWGWDTNTVFNAQEYYKPVPTELKLLGLQLLQYLELPYQWVPTSDIKTALLSSPLYAALNTCGSNWSSTDVAWCGATSTNHAVAMMEPDVIFDSYQPYLKTLKSGYQVPYTLQVLTIEKMATNAKLVQYGEGFGFFLESIGEEALVSDALNFGYPLPKTVDNKPDWSKIKPNFIIPKN